MKRISINIGGFIILVVFSIPLGWGGFCFAVYAGFVETTSVIVMSLFGKNGNGNNIEPEKTLTEEIPI